MNAIHRFYLAGGLGLTLAGTLLAQGPPPAPGPPSNLQVLDKGTSRRDVVEVMKGFTRGLGVRCQHCHVYKGDNPDDLSTFEFANDEKAEKRTARVMLRMTSAINHDLLKGVGDASIETKVTCYTCHRGDRRPLTAKPPS